MLELELLVEGVRVCSPQRRRHHEPLGATRARPFLGGSHERSSNAMRSMSLVDHEKRELANRRLVIHRVPQMHGRESGDLVVDDCNEAASQRVGRDSLQPSRDDGGLRGISELSTQDGKCVGVQRSRVAHHYVGHLFASPDTFIRETRLVEGASAEPTHRRPDFHSNRGWLAESTSGANLPESSKLRGVTIVQSRSRYQRACLQALFAGAVLISAVTPASSQVVRGSVRSRATDASVPGTVLVLIDAAGETAARTLADEHGRFALYPPFAGRYRLRAARIGFRPITSDVFTLAADTTIALELVDIPLDLPVMTTRERTQCSVRPDSGLALASLWDDVKTALLATAITREGARYRFDLVDHTRVYDFATRELLDVGLTESSLYATRAWASVPPERLRRDGYVFETRDSTAFVAPDIETLLSDYFVSAHCFRIGARFNEVDSLIPVEFDPAAKTKHVEVRGTLWIDRRSHDLRSLDFRYVNLGHAVPGADSVAGGHVGFAHLGTGGWIMTDWTIRVPVAHVASEEGPPVSLRRAGGPIILVHRHPVVDELRVSGGTLRGVFRDDSLVWSRRTRPVRIHVTSGSTNGAPASQAAVFLVGSERPFALTDTTGTATIDDLLPGAYLIEVATRELDVLGWARARVRIDADTATQSVAAVRVESPLEAARAVCLDDAKSLNGDTGVIIGNVSRGAEPVSGRSVTVSWIGDPAGAHSPGSIVTRTVRTLASDGRFLACGVPRNRPIEIRVAGDDAAPTATRLAADQVVGIVSVGLKPLP